MSKEQISYDDFAKLEITIGEIKSVEVVEGADKLLKLMVDFGPKKAAETDDVSKESDQGEGNDVSNESETEEAIEEEREVRQIISGIRTYFEDPEWLVGRKCPFLTNLEPRTIRGFESQGMILAVSHEDTLGLLIPHQDVPAGTKVK